jgi:hypothetical protein
MKSNYQIEAIIDREEELLEKDLDEGFITIKEYNAALRELHLDFKEYYDAMD